MPNLSHSCQRTTHDRLVAISTSGSKQLQVVFIAVETALVFVAVTTSEFTTALATAEVLGMHALTFESDEFALDVALAESADACVGVLGGRLGGVTGNTVRFALPLFVLLAAQVLAAACTREVFRVEFAAESRNAGLGNGKSAVMAFGG